MSDYELSFVDDNEFEAYQVKKRLLNKHKSSYVEKIDKALVDLENKMKKDSTSEKDDIEDEEEEYCVFSTPNGTEYWYEKNEDYKVVAQGIGKEGRRMARKARKAIELTNMLSSVKSLSSEDNIQRSKAIIEEISNTFNELVRHFSFVYKRLVPRQ